MPLDAARFFVLGFDGRAVPERLRALQARSPLGGVALFARNVEAPEQVRALCAGLRSLGIQLIAVDQEGGRFQRLPPPRFGAYPAACEVAPEQAREVGARMGAELSSLGITVDFAPVLDVNTNPENPIIGVRSFGSDPARVAAAGCAFVAGLQSRGVLACGKHYPGHGDTGEDSHFTLPTVSLPAGTLRAVHARPFGEAFRAGLRLVMTAHVLYPALDPDKPATFSAAILRDLLRGEQAFTGCVITDDMGMAGALSQADLPLACVEAFAAGCDLLLVCEHHDRHEEVIAALGAEIARSPALAQRADESARRIADLNAAG
jgi:beta-N-acetylhexosaminidase